MLTEAMLLALAGGILLTCITGPLGCFVVWRRMAYFGDAIAHSALIGVALGMWWEVDMRVAILLVSLLFALLLSVLRRDTRFSTDTLLGILAHGGLAAGMVLVTLEGVSASHQGHAHGHGGEEEGHALVHEVLFGDILQLSGQDVMILAFAVTAILALLRIHWRGLLLMTVQEDIAQVEAVRVRRLQAIVMAMLAMTVALAVKMVGILLIASLLILPAAAARYLARTPVSMALYAVLLGALAVTGGIAAAAQWALPAGPAVVLVAMLLFLALLAVSSLRDRE